MSAPHSRTPAPQPDRIGDQGPHHNSDHTALPVPRESAETHPSGPGGSDNRTSARIVGYALFACLAIGVALTLALVVREIRNGEHLVRVQFPELSTLGPGDPVVERGVTVGSIRSVSLENGHAIATIRFFRHTPLASDARFVNLGHSLMGARKVWLLPGTSQQPLDSRRIQQGFYVAGVPETLHKVEALTARVAQLRAWADRYFPDPKSGGSPKHGDPENKEGIFGGENSDPRAFDAWRRLDQAAQTLGDLSTRLDEAAAAVRTGMATVTQAAAAGDELTTGLRKTGPRVGSAVSRADALLGALVPLESRIEDALQQIERLAQTASDTTGAGRLLANRSDYETMVRGLGVLDSAMRALRAVGLGDDMKINAKLGNSEP